MVERLPQRVVSGSRSQAMLAAFIAASFAVLSFGLSQTALAADDYYAIVVDKTGSMNTPTGSCGIAMDRCPCATLKAEGHIATIFANDPDAQVAVLLLGYNGTGVGGEVTLAQDFTTNQNLVTAAVQGTCLGSTPLAGAACTAGDLLANAGGDSRTMVLLTDGGQLSTIGHSCDGPWSISVPPPFDPGSWQNNVWTNLVGNAVVDIGFFGPGGPITKMGDELLEDWKFFRELAAGTCGTFENFDNDVVIGPGPSCVPPAIPSIPGSGLAALALLFFGSAWWRFRRGVWSGR